MSGKTALLDLDGTLLPIETDDFIKKYFILLQEEFAGIFAGDLLIKNLMLATNEMIKNKGAKSNKDVFMEHFFALMEIDNQDEIMERFDLFYLNSFPSLKAGIKETSLSRKLVKGLKDKGYQLVLATNSLFPIEALRERVSWANVDPDDFVLITDYETMHYSKPNINYYKEILELLNLEPENCLMIGNDVQEDLVAGQLGMETFLVTDFLINRSGEEPACDWQGSLEDLLKYFQILE
ncbi:MAG TPA: HAD family hydrolase [Halanaerobiaceae bacterium]|nr:HAD family hydrolase [Bacillota bacterium]HHU92099.1 HAD family hydrolase [Halanaerobiaceae bacterium]HOA40151.1 HAD family hydrolase [Halanaerobiales bacterium]HPZ62433.1 HAD family hydrolase [Halanaerobiales bacterium]HQD03685.1 HAD family hydrolase [Halanaerobiales bacterium]